jgi:hypothetical protein
MSSARNTVVAGFNCRTAITQPGNAIISYRINPMRACADEHGDFEPIRLVVISLDQKRGNGCDHRCSEFDILLLWQFHGYVHTFWAESCMATSVDRCFGDLASTDNAVRLTDENGVFDD